jgi:acetyl esterase/lipase
VIGRRDLLASGVAGVGLLGLPIRALATDGESLAYVNPDLLPIARAILHAQQVEAETPPRQVPPPPPAPLPAGVLTRQAPGDRDQPPVTVYVVGADPGHAAPRGAILFIHGGGLIAGDARDDLRRLQSLAKRLDCVIASVQYRLAPGNPFPGPREDCYAALKWLYAEATTLGVDPARLVVMGESAGGGLAAMLTIAARDRGAIPIAFQALVYPMLDDRTASTRPVGPNIGTLIWRAADNRKGWSAFLGKPAGSRDVPPGSVPARVADLAGLPPSFIGVGSIDLFAGEDIAFARRLVGAGVPVEMLVVPGAFHGFQLIAPNAPVSRQFTTALENALMRALAPKAG